jgi:hypothetical protein
MIVIESGMVSSLENAWRGIEAFLIKILKTHLDVYVPAVPEKLPNRLPHDILDWVIVDCRIGIKSRTRINK